MRSDKVDEHLSPICDTAFLVAGMRHIDYTTVRVGDDKYAGLLAGEQGIEYASKCLATSPLNKVLSFAGNRTRYIDMNTKKYCEENDIKQILILAAGLDSRPYRLEIDTHPTFFEVDAEPVIDYKTKKMAEHSIKPIDKLVSIVHDLRDPGLREKLIAGGFNTELKAFVIIEGLFEYLPLTACVNILKLVNGMVPSGSYVMCSTPSEDLTKSKAELFKSMIDVIVENNAHPCLGTSDVEGDILKPAGFELIKLYHTLQPDYFHKPDLSDPLVIKYNEVEVKKFMETGEGPRQQFYVGRKL